MKFEKFQFQWRVVFMVPQKDHGIELDGVLLVRCFLDQLSDFNEERQRTRSFFTSMIFHF